MPAPTRSLLILILVLTCACAPDRTSPTAPANGPARGTLAWSSPATWPGGAVPGAGGTALIPAGTTVLLDVSPPELSLLHVDGTLVFGERDLTLTARRIEVVGTLRVGSEAQPFQHRATIVLSGTPADGAPTDPGVKGLVVMGGVLELHGMPRVAWTHLAATAGKGTGQIQLADPVDWQAGDRIAIASTDFDPGQSEDVVLKSASGTSLTLEQPLRSSHWGMLQSYAGRTLDERAEVGLLTRNVVVRGDSAGSAGGFGGHLMILQGSTAHIEGVEFYQMGQKSKLARYPVHWHMAGDESGNYARSNSIWRSFNRCLTVHGTDGVLVRDNVCYDDIGHGY